VTHAYDQRANCCLSVSYEHLFVTSARKMGTSRRKGRGLMNLEEEAKLTFNSGFNCAESVSLVVSKRLDKPRETPTSCIPRIATGFGGGVARNGDICGALAGGIMAISLFLGRDKPDQSRDRCYDAVDRFYNEFVKAFGSSKCCELTRFDLKKPEQREICQDTVHVERCTPMVAWSAKRAYEIIRKL
jgi:C_GCAxxG_C_C family probable redox protein